MKMLWDNVLIKKIERNVKILLPDKQARIPDKGEVVAVGKGGYYGYNDFVPTTVKVGDKVMFVRDRALEVEVCGETRYVVQERDILAVLDDKECG